MGKLPEEAKNRMINTLKKKYADGEYIPWWIKKGVDNPAQTKKGRKKISDSRKEIPMPETFKVNWIKGRKISPDICKKMSDSGKGRKVSEKTKEKLRLLHTNISDEYRKKLSDGRNNFIKNHPESLERLRGENCHLWKGGISFEPYSKEFNTWVKKQIKIRDGNKCQNPHCKNEGGRLHVHHIDYNKKNSDPFNLITLCNSCHSASNNNREYWEKLLTDIIMIKYKNVLLEVVNE